VTAAELVRRLKEARFSATESRELKAAMDAANEAFANADRH
jgi:hypothetical protein